jgi:hypothetical protein
MAELRIPITSEFKGKQAFDKAGKATVTLDKSVKRLAKTFLGVFGATAMARYARNGVAAFAENEKSARRLQTVVKNLGLAFETPIIEASLDRISAKYGFQGEVLREAYQKLLTSTGSLEKSQDLLNASLDIAAGSGFDLLTVNQDLAAAYVGQTRGLKKYNLGLTQSELKTLDFDTAVSKLTSRFKGSATNELDTYAGKMRVLQEGADNAQEIIGGGLIDALMVLTGDTSVDQLARSMSEMAQDMADFAVSTAEATKNFQEFAKPFMDSKLRIAIKNTLRDVLTGQNYGEIFGLTPYRGSSFNRETPARARRFFQGGQDSILEAKRNKERAKAEALALKRAKELAALQKKTLDSTKKQNALVKASQTLDLERISIAAALKGQISETDQLSLRLQLALLNENDEAATRLSALLTDAVERQNELNAMLLATPEAPNPYRNWKLPDTFSSAGGALSLEDLRGRSGALVVPTPSLTTPPLAMPETVPNPYAGGALPGFERRELPGGRGFIDVPTPNINITVELDGNVVGGAVREGMVNDSLSGSFNTVNRTNRFAPTGVIPD